MSLQLAAQHLSSQGRGPDDTLVHMSRNEVKSLNDLAMAHGGQLTINPQTGLPEAGFLSMILPLVAGAALGPAGMGLTAMQAGLAVGAGSYLLNPKGGLMGALSSGLGGYGGAGLGAGLEQLGTSEAGQTAQNAATKAAADAEAQAVAERTAAIQDRAKGLTGNGLTFPGESTNTGTSYAGTQPGSDLSSGGQRWGVNGREPGFDSFRTTTMQPLTPAEIQNIRMSAIDASSNLAAPPPTGFEGIKQGISSVMSDPSKLKDVGGGSWTGLAQMGLAAAAPAANLKSTGLNVPTTQQKAQVVPHYRFTPGMATPTPVASATGVENTYFPGSRYTALTNEEAASLYPGYPAAQAANGGIMGYAGGGPVERMSNDATTGQNTMYPMANMTTSAFSTPYQDPRSTNMLAPTIAPAGGGTVNMMSGEPNMQGTRLAAGGLSDAHYNLGGYSDGGRLLRGPGDGVSDSIPAVIGKKQPARLADGEFVVPARIVSELGNGSTEAGARKLYAMMDRVQASRKNTVGKGKVAKNNRADKYLPA